MSRAPVYTAAAADTRRGSRLVRANGAMNRVALQASAPIVSTEARARPTHTLYVGSDDWRAVVAVGGLFSVPSFNDPASGSTAWSGGLRPCIQDARAT